MKIANIRFDGPKHLGEPSRIFIDTMMRFLDYTRRYFERKGDKSLMKRARDKKVIQTNNTRFSLYG